MVKFSIIIPIYHSENLLLKCLDSILEQTFDNYEIILVHNNLNDETKKIIEKYKNEPKITIIEQDNNSLQTAKNNGVKASNGEYITFIESSDYLDIKYLENINNYISKNDFDIVVGSYNKIIKNKTIPSICNKFKTGNIKTSPQIITSIEYTLYSKIFKRKLIIDNNILFPENINDEDLYFISKALLKSKLVGLIKEPYYYHIITNKINHYDYHLVHLKQLKIDYKKEYYLKDEINYLIINKVFEYMYNQKEQKKMKIKNKFINQGYAFLDENISNWKNNKYYKEIKWSTRFLNNHKSLLKLYCSMRKLFRTN